MKIGCIGPSDSVRIIQQQVAEHYPEIELLTYVREETKDSWEVLEQCQKETEGILFTGIGVQEEAKARGVITRPYEHIPRGGYSLMRVLSEIHRSGIACDRLSIDVVTDEILREVVKEFGIRFEQLYTMPFALHHREQDYEARHRELYRAGKIDAAITGFGSIYQNLSREKLPVFRLYPSPFQIRENLDKLIGRITAREFRSAGIAIQIVKLKSIVQNSINQYDDMKNAGIFYLELLEYVRGLQGSLFSFGKEEYVIFSTRGVIESSLHMDHFKRLLSWGRERNIIFASGIGIGTTAFEAEKSARKALRNALDLPQGGFFIVDGEHIRGPIGERDELKYYIRVSDKEALKIAEKVGINVSYLDKIKALMTKTGKDTFDSGDLATCLGISERSARRVLKKFLDSGYGEVQAKETVHHVGRPKTLIRLLI